MSIVYQFNGETTHPAVDLTWISGRGGEAACPFAPVQLFVQRRDGGGKGRFCHKTRRGREVNAHCL